MSANPACVPVATMARVLGVSKAGFYAWLHRSPLAHAVADAVLLKRVRTVHATSRQTYGVPRVHAELRARGERHGRKRIARLMREAGLVGASHRKGGPITTRRDAKARPAPDLVDRDFTATAPDQLWVADIPYVPTSMGFLYLAVVLEAWSVPRSWAGRWPIICAPSLSSTPWKWRWASDVGRTSFTTATRAANIRPSRLASAAAKPACARPWAASATPTTILS